MNPYIFIYIIYISIYGRAPHDLCHKLLATSIQIPSQIKVNHMYLHFVFVFWLVSLRRGLVPNNYFQILYVQCQLYFLFTVAKLYNLCYSLI